MPLHDSFLARLQSEWLARGWTLDSLDRFRMEDGGGDGGDGDGGTDGGDAGGDDGGDGADLGDAGKRAIAAERSAKKAADKRAKDAETRAADLQKQLDDLQQQNQSEGEKLLQKARKDGEDAVRSQLTGELHKERVESALIRAASGKLQDPNDAVLYLAATVEVGDDGKPDPKKVEQAVTKLLEDKPYLKSGGAKPPAGGGFDGGARQTGPATAAQAAQDRLARLRAKGTIPKQPAQQA